MELHGVGEVQDEMDQIGAFVRQFMEDGSRDQFDGQLDVLELGAEAAGYQVDSCVGSGSSHQPAILWP